MIVDGKISKETVKEAEAFIADACEGLRQKLGRQSRICMHEGGQLVYDECIGFGATADEALNAWFRIFNDSTVGKDLIVWRIKPEIARSGKRWRIYSRFVAV